DRGAARPGSDRSEPAARPVRHAPVVRPVRHAPVVRPVRHAPVVRPVRHGAGVRPVRYGAGMATRGSRPARTSRTAYECEVCGYQPAKWVGRCPECGEWGSIAESAPAPAAGPAAVPARAPQAPARPTATYSVAPAQARPTGVAELDRVLGGGLVPGSVVLLAGEPGVGKSTLLLDVAQQWAAGDGDAGPALVISGEESVGQVRLRAERIGALHDRLYLAAETDLAAVLGHLDSVKPGLLVLDSVQTITATGIDGVPGGVT